MIRPVPQEPIRIGGPTPGTAADSGAQADGWERAYWLMQQQFAAETRRTSALIAALHALGHRAALAHPGCEGCRALLQAGSIDPLPAPAAVAALREAGVLACGPDQVSNPNDSSEEESRG